MGCGLYLQPLMTMRTSSVGKKRNKTKLVSICSKKGIDPNYSIRKKCCSKCSNLQSKVIFKEPSQTPSTYPHRPFKTALGLPCLL